MPAFTKTHTTGYLLARLKSETHWKITRAWRLSNGCGFSVPEHASDGTPAPGLRGLMWGLGDPKAADWPDTGDWLVVRIDDPTAVRPLGDITTANPGAVEVYRGFVVYRGDLRTALEALVYAGANPHAMSIRLVPPSDHPISWGDDWCFAIAGPSGVARTGDHGQAIAEQGGAAFAGDFGRASAKAWGLAVVGRGGRAEAEVEGVAVVRGPGGHAQVGERAVAVALVDAGTLSLGNESDGIALGTVHSLGVGDHCLAVILNAPQWLSNDGLASEGTRARSAKGSTVVARAEHADGSVGFVVAHYPIAGEVQVRHFRTGRHIHNPHTLVAAETNRNPSLDIMGPATWWEQAMAVGNNAVVRTGPVAPGVTLVLNQTLPIWACLGEIDVKWEDTPTGDRPAWDPDPESLTGLFGLAWGRGDPDRAGSGGRWRLIEVENPISVPSATPGTVKFERGTAIYAGSCAGAIAALTALGEDPTDLAIAVVEAGVDKIAVATGADIAIAPDKGWAIAAKDASAGSGGYAATAHGVARVGDHGTARTNSGGEAIAGKGGLALAHGQFNVIEVGDRGAALALDQFNSASAGDGGCAFGVTGADVSARHGAVAIGSDKVSAGVGSIAVVRGRGMARGGDGCLLIFLSHDEPPVCALVGDMSDGEPVEAYVWYVRAGSTIKRYAPSDADEPVVSS